VKIKKLKSDLIEKNMRKFDNADTMQKEQEQEKEKEKGLNLVNELTSTKEEYNSNSSSYSDSEISFQEFLTQCNCSQNVSVR